MIMIFHPQLIPGNTCLAISDLLGLLIWILLKRADVGRIGTLTGRAGDECLEGADGVKRFVQNETGRIGGLGHGISEGAGHAPFQRFGQWYQDGRDEFSNPRHLAQNAGFDASVDFREIDIAPV